MRVHAIAAAAALVAAGLAGPAVAQDNMAHAHIGHVMTGWQDTPNGWGLLPTAQAEADVAAQHIAFALADPGNLASIQTHAAHVLHAVAPDRIAQGPGHGYGVERAAEGVAAHIGMAAGSEGASDNVQLHAEHVATSAGNVAEWARQVADLTEQVMASGDAADAAEKAREAQRLIGCIREGCDADGDGQVSWGPGEGGLAQAGQHMGFMMAGEGMDG